SSRRHSLILPIAVPSPYPGHHTPAVTPVPSMITDCGNMNSSGYASETSSSEHESLSEIPVQWKNGRVGKSGRKDTLDSETLSMGERIASLLVSSDRVSRSSLLSDSEWKAKDRRRSVPVVSRSYFTDDVMRVLERDGHLRYETDVDTGLRTSQFDIRSSDKQENVIGLSRRYSEINASQDLARYKSRTQRRRTLIADTIAAKPTVGGIATLSISRGELRTGMSRVNIFKQMDAQNKPAVPVCAPRSPNSIKDALLRWVQNRVEQYPISITNFSSSWSDGMAFCALTHRFAPGAFDFASLKPENRKENFDLAFRVAEEYGIPALLETEDMIMMGDRPDWKCVFTYVQQFYKKFREAP
ncbi:hypothetical protein PFISCL1PPCAC_8773, partial [Pristionchus fissidentatus]